MFCKETPNETVEKVILNDPILLSTGIQHAVKEWLSSSLPGFLSLSRPIMVDFTNIVYQGK